MTIYSAVLFLHVLSAIALFIAFLFEGVIFIRIRSARSIEQARFFTRTFSRLWVIYVTSFVGILVGGMYLASQYGGRSFWIPTALLATLMIVVVGGVVTGRKMARLKKMLAGEAAGLEVVLAEVKGNSLVVSYGLRIGLALWILFLMTAKTQLIPSLAALSGGLIVGLLAAANIRRISDHARNRCNTWGRASRSTAAGRS